VNCLIFFPEVNVKVCICLKQVPDTEASLSIREGNQVNEAAIKWIISPYDEYAIEEALKYREKNPATQVIALSAGPERVQNALRTALAMGVNEAVHIEAPADLDSATTAQALAAVIAADPDIRLVFTGKQAIDDDAHQVHTLLAARLGMAVASGVIAFQAADDHVLVEREIDEGARERIRLPFPCLVAATKGLNSPRYASVMGIMKAKKIPIRQVTLADLGVALPTAGVRLLKLTVPAEKPQGRILPGEPAVAAAELVRLLRDEAKVL